jgi:tetratricopeptide (TPR) repeat protein
MFAGKGAPRPWILPLVIVLLAVAASLSGIKNQWAQDDIPIIWKNDASHHLSGIGWVFTKSDWPPPFIPALYRPFASVFFTLQWVMGGGSPLSFRLISYSLYALTSVAVFSLARTILPAAVALAVAALFAVHPVHVEAVAVAVNQSELWVGLISCIAVTRYVQERRTGPLSMGTELLLAVLYLAACLFKENALVLPGLLVVAEVLLVPSEEPLRDRIALGRRPLLLMILVGVAFYWVRTQVLSGNLTGTFTAEGLQGLSVRERTITMIGIVPQWFRLLLWPVHLQADYSPGEIMAQTAWGPAQTLGALLLMGTAAAAIAALRRAPVISFGLAWCAIGVFPVHNILVPTGIMLAERTLFLPSIGVVIALGGLGALLLQRRDPTVRTGLAMAVAALAFLGVYRSATRHPVWSDQFNLWYQTANVDAPKSFHAHEAMAETYFNIGVEKRAEQEYQLAIQFSPKSVPRPRLAYAERLRSRGFCYPAAVQYRKVLQVQQNNIGARASLIACLLDLGLYREALLQARLGISYDWERPAFQMALATAEYASRTAAPPGTVRLTVPASSKLGAAIVIGTRK